jgi:predicted PurR-regulated permease PerM
VHGLAAGVTMAGVVMSLGFFYAKNPVLDVLLWASLLMAVTYTIVFLLSRYIFTTVDTELAPVPHPEPEVPEPQENLEEQ